MTWDDTIPTTWMLVPFEELAAPEAPIVYGIIQPGEDVPDGVPYVRPVDVIDGQIMVDRLPRAHSKIAARYQRSSLEPGDIVLSIVGTIGKVAVVPPSLVGANITQTSVRIRRVGLVANDWIRYALLTPQMRRQFQSKIFGLGLQRLNVAHVRECEVPLASIGEQRRVVEKLDAVFEKSRVAGERLERLRTNLEKLRRSILAAAFRGDLTAERRAAQPDPESAEVVLARIHSERRIRWEEGVRATGKNPEPRHYKEPASIDAEELPELPECWTWTSLDSLAWDSSYGTSQKCSYEGKGEAVLRIPNVAEGRINLVDLKRTISSLPLHENDRLRRGDVLIVRTNGSRDLIGRAACVGTEGVGHYFASYLIRFRLVRPDLGEWLTLWWESAFMRKWLESAAASSAGQYNLSMSSLALVPVPIPPSSELNLITHASRTALAAVSKSLLAVEAMGVRLEALESAALAKAFRGELLPQDAADEPASLLLERIRAARSSAPERRRERVAVRRSDKIRSAEGSNSKRVTDVAPLDLVVATLLTSAPLSPSLIVRSTGLEAAAVDRALKQLVATGNVEVARSGRSKTYAWRTT